MKRDVRITLRGEQSFANGEKDSVEFTTEGTLTTADWGCQLDYDESVLTGMEGAHTAVRVRGGSVSLLRTGTFRARMRFEPGKKHTAPYETPYGSFSMSVLAHTLRGGLTEQGGTLEIGYVVELEHVVSGDNRFLLTVVPWKDRKKRILEKEIKRHQKGWLRYDQYDSAGKGPGGGAGGAGVPCRCGEGAAPRRRGYDPGQRGDPKGQPQRRLYLKLCPGGGQGAEV